MRPDNAVPDMQLLKRFLLGQLSGAEAVSIESYLEQHPDIASTLAELVKEDTLVGSLRASMAQPAAGPPELAGLMDKLSQLRPAPVGDATIDLDSGKSVAAPSGDETFAGLAPPQSPDEIGRLGGYRILKMLGAGGMGMVYQAEDVHLQRPIALKVMKAEVAKNPSNRERFLREARAAAKLKSDHVVTIHQVGEDNQVVFLAMEFLEGMSLDDWLKKGRKPTLAQAARIGRQIALGLADAHACGLIHRDIKPANIWLDSRHQGRAKLLDFGLARGDKEEVQLTQSGAIVGTPAYMAPEQARSEHVDHRCDLFSLGVVLYRLTTGRLPFRGDNTMSVLTSLALDNPTPPREVNTDIPPRMAALIERLLSKNREQRPATAKAVADELAIIEREATQPATDERTLERAAHEVSGSSNRLLRARLFGKSRLRWLVAASLLLLLGGIAAAIVVIIRDKDGNKVAEINVPPGGSVETKDKAEDKAKPAPKQESKVAAAGLAPLLPNEPLSPIALVQHPAKLPGVRSWSIESRNVHNPAAMAYRPDGKRLAVVCGGGVFRIWEPESGRLVQVLLESDSARSLAWSPDGRTLALGCQGKQPVRLFDAETGRFLRGLEAPVAGFGYSLAWSDDGRKVRALLNVGPNCHTWNAADGKLLSAVQITCHYPTFSPNGKQMAGRIDDGPLAVWDVETGKEVRQLGTPTSTILELAWSPKGDRLACMEAKSLGVWDVKSGKESFTHPEATGGGMTWSPDGQHLAYNLAGGWGAATLKLEPGAKPERLEDMGAAFLAWSPDGKSIARLVHQHKPRLYLHDAANGKRLRSLSEGAWSNALLAFSPPARMIALCEGPGQTFLSSVDTGQTAAVLKDTYGPLAWSPDGKTLAKGGPNHTINLWDDGVQTRIKLTGHQGDVQLLAWSPDGKRLASWADGEKRMLLWDAVKGELLRELGPIPAGNPNYRMIWSADGRFLAFPASPVTELGWHFWDVEQNKLVNNPKEWKERWLAFSPDGRSALVGSYGDVYHLRDRISRKEVRSLPVAVGPNVRPPVWSPDGGLLAVSVNWGVELWRGDLRRRVRTLRATYGEVYQIAFSPDGKWTFGQAGERLHVWETDTGRLSGILMLGEKNNGLTIAADGHYIGNDQVERGIVMVVQKDDGTQEVLEPADFEQKYGFTNHPAKVHLLKPLPPPLYPLPGMPMGRLALVREPAELPDATATSWTIETVNARGLVVAVAYRPDGKLLASGGEDGTIRIWDTANGKLVRMLVGDPVRSLSWSKDGKILAAAILRNNGKTVLWEADAGRLLRRIEAAPLAAVKTARSPDGKQTATADEHGVHLHDAAGKRVRTLETARQLVPALSVSADGRRLLLATWNEDPVSVVDAATGKPLPSPVDATFEAAWSPDGKLLAASAPGGRVRLWNAVTREPVRTLEGRLIGHRGPLAWSMDSKKLAVGNPPHLWVWSAETGKLLWQNDKQQNVRAVAWSPEGRWLATSDHESKTVRIWEADSGKLVHEAPFSAWFLPWSPDGKTVAASAAVSYDCRLIDAASGAVRLKVPGEFPRWSADGKSFVTITWWGIHAWDAATGAQRWAVPFSQLPRLGPWAARGWSADGRLLARCNGYEIHLCDGDGRPLGVLLWGERSAQLAITPDGQYRGNARVERAIRMVVQKRDGSSETLTPSEFEQKYHFKNEPDKVRLIEK